jgi:GNAT superfamily N-acetyltransferase
LTQIRVRAVGVADQARWDDLWAGYLEFYGCTLDSAITDYTWQRLHEPQSGLLGLVAVDAQDRVQGFVHYHFHLSTWSRVGYCYLEDLFVDSAARGLGAGRALIEAVYAAADARGAERVYWSTQEGNVTARALYDRLAKVAPFVQYRR